MSYVAQPVEVEAITDDWLAKTGYKLGYWRRGRTAHLFIKNVLGGDDALCNKTNSPWAEALGTGTQNEYDRARSLPLCTRCADHAMVRTVAGVPVTDCDGLITNLTNANNAAVSAWLVKGDTYVIGRFEHFEDAKNFANSWNHAYPNPPLFVVEAELRQDVP